MATHSSILAWKIPWTVEPGELQSMGLQKSDMTERLHSLTFICMHTYICMYIYALFHYDLSSVQFSHSVVSNSATSGTVAYQAPLSMGFSRQ